MAIFDKCIRSKLGDSLNKLPIAQEDLEWDPYEDDKEESHANPENNIKLGNFHVALADSLINAKVLIHQGKEGDGSNGPLIKVRLLRHLTDDNENLVGIPN